MYPFLRLATTIGKSSYRYLKGERLALTDVSELRFRVRLNDIDNFLEVNNGRILTLFDLGRTDFAVATGLGKKLIEHRWGLVVAGSSIQYRKRIRAYDKITIKTKLSAIDERWFYIEQSIWIKGNCACVALLRTAVTSLHTGKALPTKQVLDAVGYADASLPPSDWVAAWIAVEKDRPFPSGS